MIQFFHVNKSYNKDIVLSDINLNIEKGEFIFLTGASGAGKTTLLKLIFCVEQTTQGQILVNNINLARLNRSRRAKLRQSMGFVFQDFNLLPNRSVQDNVMFPLDVASVSRREGRKRVRVMLKNLGLEHKIHLKPPPLSGGEQQRVAIARAIINDPILLLADEPTGNLDPDNTSIVMEILNEVNARGTTVIVATHDISLIERYPRRVIHLSQGRVASS